MKLSLLLISERLSFDDCEKLLLNPRSSVYREVMMYAGNLSAHQEILYVSDGLPENLPKDRLGYGLVCRLSPEEYRRHKKQPREFPCDCLLLCTEANILEVFNVVSCVFIQLRRQIDIFKTAAYTRQNLQMLIEMIYDILGNPAYLVDSSFKVLAIDRNQDMRNMSATWKRLEDEGYLSFDLVSNLINSGELSLMETDKSATCVISKYFYVPFINFNLRQQGVIQGHLFIAGMKNKILKSDVELAGYLGEYVLHAMMHNPRFQNERGNYYEYFMRDMFSGKLENELHIRQQMRFLGLLPDDYYTVVVLHPSPEHGLSDERIANQLERCSGAKPVFYNDKIVALFSHGKTPDRPGLNKKLDRIYRSLDCEIGVSDVFRGFYDVSTYYTQAEWALISHNPNQEKGRDQAIRFYSDYAAKHLIHEFKKEIHWKTLVLPELLRLKECEDQSRPELVNTLYAYLLRERAVLETAEFLHIHRNTLSYRINKIVELCGFDLDDIATRKRLLLSLEVMQNCAEESDKNKHELI